MPPSFIFFLNISTPVLGIILFFTTRMGGKKKLILIFSLFLKINRRVENQRGGNSKIMEHKYTRTIYCPWEIRTLQPRAAINNPIQINAVNSPFRTTFFFHFIFRTNSYFVLVFYFLSFPFPFPVSHYE